MIKTINALNLQKDQLIKDVKTVRVKERFRGMPEILGEIPVECAQICPTKAIYGNKIDLGKCIFCGECSRICPNVKFTNDYRLSATEKEGLIVPLTSDSIAVNEYIRGIFGHSLKLRQVSAGGCNSCEMELMASTNANFDIGRYGIEFTASPRHADGIIITGPITKNMAYALEETYNAMPEPKIIILAGACAISGGIFQNSDELDRSFLDDKKIDLYIPGCPIHPLTLINGILEFLGR